MKQSVVKAVNAILRQIEETPDVLCTEGNMRSWLATQGYNKRDIDAAMKLVAPRFAMSAPVEDSRPRGLRQFALYEHARLSPEARSALTRLELHDLLDPMEREMIIERLLQYDGEVDMDALDYLLSSVFGTMRNVEAQNAMYNTFEGFGPTLH